VHFKSLPDVLDVCSNSLSEEYIPKCVSSKPECSSRQVLDSEGLASCSVYHWMLPGLVYSHLNFVSTAWPVWCFLIYTGQGMKCRDCKLSSWSDRWNISCVVVTLFGSKILVILQCLLSSWDLITNTAQVHHVPIEKMWLPW